MPSMLISNIKQLLNTRQTDHALRGEELAELPFIDNAYLIIEDGHIAEFGEMNGLKNKAKSLPAQQLDVSGQLVLPAWCDSHTHIVHSGSREDEFVDKLKGKSYAEIAANGGGILNSARKLRAVSEDQLFNESFARVREAAKLGTGSLEIKSGYGLTVESELKMLRVIKRIKERSPLTIKSTFLGAHALPPEYSDDREGYIRLLTDEMLPAIGAEKLADFIDVFCEQGFFTVEETGRICKAGMRYGLRVKLHANQLSASGAVETGIALNALSVDHLEVMNEAAIIALSRSPTIGTLLPSAAFFLRMAMQPARELITAGCAIALASDCNPGSSPSCNMNFVVALSCIAMKMLPEEAINAATINGACAMDVQRHTGSIATGKKADLIITRPIPSLAYLPYAFGSDLIDKVIINGEFL